MRAVIQRVTEASVSVEQKRIAHIDLGLLVLLGIADTDTPEDARYLADKSVHLRIFQDTGGKMNLSLIDIKASMLVVSQFTLMGDTRKGRRPNFTAAAGPAQAESLYRLFQDCVRQHTIPVASGEFGASMEVHLVNNGPVTLLLDSQRSF